MMATKIILTILIKRKLLISKKTPKIIGQDNIISSRAKPEQNAL